MEKISDWINLRYCHRESLIFLSAAEHKLF